MKSTFSHITAAVLILVLQGCAVYDPVASYTKQRYINAVSYFNTYYNAQRLFSDAEDEVLKARRDFYERNVSGKLPQIPNSARQKFQTSIEKNSKVLTFYADSKWVDDALMMIGKAYYYMEDDVRAERKFLELAAQFPDGGLILESQLWLGKSLLRQKKFEQGVKQLTDVVTKATGSDDELAGLASYELGQYHFERNEFEEAERQYSVAADLVSDSELQTRIFFQIGKCFTEMGQNVKAQQAYQKAMDNSPIYSMKFQAQIQYLKLLAREKKFQESKDGLSEMLDDTKNSDFFGTIHYELAGVMMQNGEIEQSLEKYRYIDTAFARTDEAARSYFVLAEYYQTKELNYDSARVLYGKARAEYAASEITKTAVERSEIFNKYDQLRKDLSKFDSLIVAHVMAKAKSDSVALNPMTDSLSRKDSVSTKEEPKIKKMTKAGKTVKDSVTALPSVDSTKIKERLSKEELYTKVLDSLQRSIVRTKFELGGLFFLEIQQPDSAQRWFNEVVETAPLSDLAPRSLFTLAEIYRGLNRPSSELEPYYRRIIADFPTSPYANESRRYLSIPEVSVVKDSAVALYERAESQNDDRQYEQAIVSFKRIAESFPASPLASKALFTAGWIYEHSLVRPDSAVAVYKRVIAKFPLSAYASKARPKVEEYDNEVKRVEAEKKRLEEEKKQAEIDKKEKERKERETKNANEKSGETSPADTLITPKK